MAFQSFFNPARHWFGPLKAVIHSTPTKYKSVALQPWKQNTHTHTLTQSHALSEELSPHIHTHIHTYSLLLTHLTAHFSYERSWYVPYASHYIDLCFYRSVLP